MTANLRHGLEHFPTEVVPGSAKKMLQNIDLERCSDSVGTECALVVGTTAEKTTVEWWNARATFLSVNIKNAEAHALATRLACLTGESLTEAVTTALHDRLARVEHPDELAAELLDFGQSCTAPLPEPWRSADHGARRHDDHGLTLHQVIVDTPDRCFAHRP
jgi:antitoxin VapB